MNVYVFDIDSTLANNLHRQPLLRDYCIQCGGGAYFTDSVGPFSRTGKVCVSCGGEEFVIPPKSWQAFTEPDLMALDKPYPKAQLFIRKLQASNQPLHYITGRQDNSRDVTEQWLKTHFVFDEHKNSLLMRKAHSYTDTSKRHAPASAHKETCFIQLREIQSYFSNGLLFHFFDDDPHALKMYGKYGLTYLSPRCWEVIDPTPPIGTEKLFSQ